ncbi:uncharacterized protein LOC112964854 isoform X1 [Apteryx rowi]|uniref:uncharacterized protein LOC112964854 isoform X1 n=1 Tax=Apteryx rowi TaxID=308060 RepID=UPI000E1D9F6A|nr:uncharacterized protein LOC112964854 isoform X1 [Apteryx rowi]
MELQCQGLSCPVLVLAVPYPGQMLRETRSSCKGGRSRLIMGRTLWATSFSFSKSPRLLGSQEFTLKLQTSIRNIAAALGTCRSSCGDELCMPGILLAGILLKMNKDFWKMLLSVALGRGWPLSWESQQCAPVTRSPKKPFREAQWRDRYA